MGSVAGAINSRGAGARKMLSDYRNRKARDNLSKMKAGERFTNNRISKPFNKLTENIGLGARGRFGIGRQGRQARSMNRAINSRNRLKSNEQLQQLAFDDNANGLLALSGGTEKGARDVANRLIAANQMTVEQKENAISAIKATGGFTTTGATAALQTMAQNKSRILSGAFKGKDGLELVETSINQLSGNDRTMRNSMMNTFNYDSRNAGRIDLGGDTPGAGWAKTSVAQHAQSDNNSMEAYAEYWQNQFTTAGENTDQEKNASIALLEMQNMLPNATAANQDTINRTLSAVGIDHTNGVPTETQIQQILQQRGSTLTSDKIRGDARVYDSSASTAQIQNSQQQAAQNNQQNNGGHTP